MQARTGTPGQRIKQLREGLQLTQQQLAEACGWSSSGRIANYESDFREPKVGDWVRLARALNTSPAYLQFGDESDLREGVPRAGLVPLVSWVQAGSWSEVADPYAVGDAEAWLPGPLRAGPRTFALRVRGISMEPLYFDGDVIFVDPDVEPRHGRRVVVRLERENEATFKELVMEGDRRYLKALNPRWPDPIIKVDDGATICGVVIERRVQE